MASTYLAQRISASSGEVADKWTEIETLFSRKYVPHAYVAHVILTILCFRLWHQLTVLLEEFVNHSCFASGGLVEVPTTARCPKKSPPPCAPRQSCLVS